MPLKKIALVGFSAGATVALDTVAHMSSPLAGVVSHAGCVLDPASLPAARGHQHVLLIHRMDDLVFSYEKRYYPSKKALKEKKYHVYTYDAEMEPSMLVGGHCLLDDDILVAANFLKPNLGYEAKEKERFHYCQGS